MKSEWKEYKISEFADVIGGGTPSTKIEEYYNGTIPWLTPRDMSTHSSKYISEGARSITSLGLKKSSARLVPKDTVLFTSRAPIGYIAIAKQEVSTNQGFKSLICNDKIAHNEYIYYLLKSKVFAIESIASGSTFKEVSGSVLKNFILQLPSIPTQKRIAHILSTLDDKIELNRKMNQTLEEMAQALFKSWFVDFDPVHGKAKCTSDKELEEAAKELGISKEVLDLFPSEFEESELGMIPKRWKVSNIEDFAKVVDCLHSKKPLEVNFYTGKILLQLNNIQDDGLLNINKVFYIAEEDYQKWISRIEVTENDFVITNVGRVGAVSRIPKSFKAAIGRNMTAIRLSSLEYVSFLQTALTSTYMKNEIVKKTDVGTILNALNVKNIPKLRLIIADDKLMKMFDFLIAPLQNKREQMQQEIQTLQQTRDTLLPKLLSGELDVSELDMDIK